MKSLWTHIVHFCVSQIETKERILSEKTTICSCCIQSSCRFCKSVKKIVSADQYELCCFPFSLLLNCLDLESMTNIVKLIRRVFLAKKQTLIFKDSLAQLLKLIKDRPLEVRISINKMDSLYQKNIQYKQMAMTSPNFLNIRLNSKIYY